MTYGQWYASQAEKHAAVMAKLTDLDPEAVVEYFSFESMVKNEPDFCLLYATQTKCHAIEHLNCYMCACPHFRFNDNGVTTVEGKTLYSYCAINAPQGRRFESDDAIHHDCSACTVPHHKTYILNHFSRDWKAIMKQTIL